MHGGYSPGNLSGKRAGGLGDEFLELVEGERKADRTGE